jgi:hypothetical protein
MLRATPIFKLGFMFLLLVQAGTLAAGDYLKKILTLK